MKKKEETIAAGEGYKSAAVAPRYVDLAGTCGCTNESLTFPVNCGFMVYRRTAETFYCSAMRDNARADSGMSRPK